eukprot:PhF_6_TR4277/c0_g1_i2/m.5779
MSYDSNWLRHRYSKESVFPKLFSKRNVLRKRYDPWKRGRRKRIRGTELHLPIGMTKRGGSIGTNTTQRLFRLGIRRRNSLKDTVICWREKVTQIKFCFG